MVKKILNIFKYLLMVFMIIILIINLTSLFSIYVLHNDYPNIFGYTYFEVATGSMREDIKEQDIVIVKITKDFEVGDIITYYSDDSFITHRVETITGDTIVTKGDFNNVSDEPIDRQRVVGKVVKNLSGLGTIIKVVTDKVTILLVLAFIIIISYLSSLKDKE